MGIATAIANSNLNARIFTIQHPFELINLTPKIKMDDVVNHLRNDLKEFGVGKRPVVFIVHSMGGLITKDLLCTDSNYHEDSIFNKIPIGCVFLGTPHLGSKIISPESNNTLYHLMASCFIRSCIFKYFFGSTINDYLGYKCNYVMDLSKRFIKLLNENPERIETLYVAEHREVVLQIVTRNSAYPKQEICVHPNGGPKFQRLNANSSILYDKHHMDMCRTTPDSNLSLMIKEFAENIIKEKYFVIKLDYYHSESIISNNDINDEIRRRIPESKNSRIIHESNAFEFIKSNNSNDDYNNLELIPIRKKKNFNRTRRE